MENFVKREGIVILPPNWNNEQRKQWILELKEKLGGIKLLVNQKMVSQLGPPGFDYTYATDIAWLISWKPVDDNDPLTFNIEAWQRQLPRDIGPALEAGAIDLRG